MGGSRIFSRRGRGGGGGGGGWRGEGGGEGVWKGLFRSTKLIFRALPILQKDPVMSKFFVMQANC